jgi:uncharacterized protein (DUF111 family)
VVGEEQPAAAGARAPVSLADILGQGEVIIQAMLDEVGADRSARLLEDLVEAGAADAWITQVVGRKGRPGLSVSAVAPAERRDQVVRCLRDSAGAANIRIAPVITASTKT